MHAIDFDPARACLSIRVEGFWEPSDIPRFAAALRENALQARARAPDFDVIVESLAFPVQANDVADMLKGIMQQSIGLTTGHVAVVVGSELSRLQAERTLAHPRIRVFRSLDEAVDWLAERKALARPRLPD
jgi:hypothetical protein